MAVSVCMYATPTVAFGAAPLKVSAGSGLTSKVTGAVVLKAGVDESVAVTFSWLLPAVVGVPVTVHPAFKTRPAGRVPEARLQ